MFELRSADTHRHTHFPQRAVQTTNLSLADLPPQLAHLECVDCNLTGSLVPLPPALRRLDLSDNNLVGEIEGLDLAKIQVRLSCLIFG